MCDKNAGVSDRISSLLHSIKHHAFHLVKRVKGNLVILMRNPSNLQENGIRVQVVQSSRIFTIFLFICFLEEFDDGVAAEGQDGDDQDQTTRYSFIQIGFT